MSLNKKELTVLVDIDGTLNDFQNHFFATLDRIGIPFDASKSDTYYMERCIRGRGKKSIMNSIFKDPEFWLTVPVLDNAKEGLEYLNRTYTVWIVTSPWDEQNKETKLQWMRREFPFIDSKQIIFSHNKWELKGDIIIEDKPDTIKKCSQAGFITITKLQPYNLHMHTDEFLYSWKDVKSIMDKVVEETFFDDM